MWPLIEEVIFDWGVDCRQTLVVDNRCVDKHYSNSATSSHTLTILSRQSDRSYPHSSPSGSPESVLSYRIFQTRRHRWSSQKSVRSDLLRGRAPLRNGRRLADGEPPVTDRWTRSGDELLDWIWCVWVMLNCRGLISNSGDSNKNKKNKIYFYIYKSWHNIWSYWVHIMRKMIQILSGLNWIYECGIM